MLNKEASITKEITEKDIIQFANISGDFNRIHLDENYAKNTRFKKRIAHGMYISRFISSIIANKLPGEGSIYLSQTLNFLNPVYIGDYITTSVKIITIKKNIYTLECKCVNQNKDLIIEGIAKILFYQK